LGKSVGQDAPVAAGRILFVAEQGAGAPRGDVRGVGQGYQGFGSASGCS